MGHNGMSSSHKLVAGLGFDLVWFSSLSSERLCLWSLSFLWCCIYSIFCYIFLLTAGGLQPAELIVWVTHVCLSVWIPSNFSNRYSSYSLSPILMKLANMIYVPISKKRPNRFSKI